MSLGPLQAPVTKTTGPGGRGCNKAILCESQMEGFDEDFGCLPQDHPDGENDQVKGFLHDLILLRIGQSHPQVVRPGSVVYFRGKAPDETNPFVLPAGIEEGLEGGSRRLNVHVEKGRLHLRVLMPDGLDQTKRIGTADLRAVEVSNGLVPAPHALKEGNLLRELPVRGTGKDPAIAKHFVEILGGDHVLVSPISIFLLLGGIVRIDPGGNDDGRGLSFQSLLIFFQGEMVFPRTSFDADQLGLGEDRDVSTLQDLGNPLIHHTGKTFVAGLRCLAAEGGGKAANGSLSFDQGGRKAHLGQFQSPP